MEIFNMKYYTIHETKQILGVSAQTLRNWDKSGKLKPHHRSSNGYRYYSESDLNVILGKRSGEGITVGYCRVSSNKQKDDLVRQEDNIRTYLLAQGKPFEIISDIGSGINYNRKGLQEIIRRMADRSISKVVVLYKDRLARLGYDLIKYIADLYGCEIEIIDNTEKTEQQELVEDLVQIITVFSCKLQGKRANKAKKMIQEIIDDDDKEL
jgi:predicted site-specific integrase-resolvase